MIQPVITRRARFDATCGGRKRQTAHRTNNITIQTEKQIPQQREAEREAEGDGRGERERERGRERVSDT